MTTVYAQRYEDHQNEDRFTLYILFIDIKHKTGTCLPQLLSNLNNKV